MVIPHRRSLFCISGPVYSMARKANTKSRDLNKSRRTRLSAGPTPAAVGQSRSPVAVAHRARIAREASRAHVGRESENDRECSETSQRYDQLPRQGSGRMRRQPAPALKSTRKRTFVHALASGLRAFSRWSRNRRRVSPIRVLGAKSSNPGGTSRATTLPAPISAPSSIETPGKMIAPPQSRRCAQCGPSGANATDGAMKKPAFPRLSTLY